MAFDPKPSTWLPNWSEDGTTISLPIASLSELTAAEADATTGDIRKVVFALCEHLHEKWNETASADRPAEMTISKTASQNVATGEIANTYTFRFNTEIISQEVVAEG
jgi:hypothetical protein